MKSSMARRIHAASKRAEQYGCARCGIHFVDGDFAVILPDLRQVHGHCLREGDAMAGIVKHIRPGDRLTSH